MCFSGDAEVCEWFDDVQQCSRIQAIASNRTWGDLFGYSGLLLDRRFHRTGGTRIRLQVQLTVPLCKAFVLRLDSPESH
ncbi:DUF4166 domain-containing protein [Edaphobacter aggregans]|uniref:DUF4166 domain-containing protein n=1 Tax=Edaphobacter aggregans TaxID=570835 RepID=UPI003918616C